MRQLLGGRTPEAWRALIGERCEGLASAGDAARVAFLEAADALPYGRWLGLLVWGRVSHMLGEGLGAKAVASWRAADALAGPHGEVSLFQGI